MKAIIFAMLLLMVSPAYAEPKVTLDIPDQVKPGTTSYEVSKLEFHFGEGPQVMIVLVGDNGEVKTLHYVGAEAADLIADPVLNSLRARLLRRLVADGFLAGIVEE